MIRVLKIRQKPVLHFRDLRERFLPMEIYEQLESFIRFAAVHCVPLPMQLTQKESCQRYVAEYLTKRFWLHLLCRVKWPEVQNVTECFWKILEEEAEDMADGCEEKREEIQKAFEREAEDGQIEEKLKVIWEGRGGKRSCREILSLLAICELAEINVRKMEKEAWKEELQEEKTNPDVEKTDHDSILFFPDDQEISLIAGNDTLKYWYHDGEQLDPGAVIHTVRVAAKGGINQYALLRIALYSQQTKQCVQEISLKKGEYRYCNVSAGKIIKFLPDISISDDLCLMRKRYDQAEITVIPREGESWTLDGEGISSFCAGSGKQGMMLIQKGRVNSRFYRDAEDFFIRLQLDLVALPVVEVRIEGGDYSLLLEDGSVVTGRSGMEKKNVAYLSDEGRAPLLSVFGGGSREAVLSLSGKSLAILGEMEGKEKVIFDGDREFSVQDNATGKEIWL